jgi:hypothetical protein
MKPGQFKYHAASTADEAVAMLAEVASPRLHAILSRTHIRPQ